MTTHQRVELPRLCQRFGVHRLDLFGSATGDEFDPVASDLDFLVEYAPGRNLGPWLRDYFALRDSLAALFQRPVDLVVSSAVSKRHFAREVERTRQPIYAG
jgi:predicted nucleotidyltransferase